MVAGGGGTPITWRDVVHRGPDDLRARVDLMPEEAWSRDPAALLALAASYRSPGSTNPYAADPYLDAAAELLDEGAGDAPLRVLVPILRSTCMRELGRFGDGRRILEDAARQLGDARLPVADRVELHALILLGEGVCRMFSTDLEGARPALLRALHVAEARTPASVQAEASGCLALIELRAGSLRGADAHLAAASPAAAAAGRTHPLSTAPMRLAAVAVAIEHGTADGLDARLSTLLAETAGTEYAPLALAELAAAHESDDDGVIDVLQELQLAIREWETPNLPRMLHDDSRLALLVQRHEAVAARAEIARIEPDAAHTRCPATWSARLLLDAGQPAHAIELIAPCLAMGDGHSPRTATLAILVAASAHALLGDHRTADALFSRALTLAAPTGSVRPFGILPRRQLTQLVSRAERASHPPAVETVIAAIAARYPSCGDDAPDTLSVRERLVLERLVEGETQQRISFELSVSPNTIKTQVRSIYRKLGVSTRDGALQRARSLGLLD
jgi:LuxR family maltose regulon positive regulatory protein